MFPEGGRAGSPASHSPREPLQPYLEYQDGAGIDQAQVGCWDIVAVHPFIGVLAWLLLCCKMEPMSLKCERQS